MWKEGVRKVKNRHLILYLLTKINRDVYNIAFKLLMAYTDGSKQINYSRSYVHKVFLELRSVLAGSNVSS